jgi:hypothetical protein
LIDRIKQTLLAAMEKAGADRLAPLVGRRAAEWATRAA